MAAAGASAYTALGNLGIKKIIIINLLGLNLNTRHRAIVENIVFNLCARFNDDRFLKWKSLSTLKIWWQPQEQEQQEQRSWPWGPVSGPNNKSNYDSIPKSVYSVFYYKINYYEWVF